VNGAWLIALLNSGSTQNFIDMEVAWRMGVRLHDDTGLCVAITVDRLSCTGSYKDLATIAIGAKPFTISYYGLLLGFYETVLDVQWLESLRPILWDFTSRTMAFIRDGHRVVWSAAASSPTPPTLLASSTNVMEDLLQQFASLFEVPRGLPPPLPRSGCCQARRRWRSDHTSMPTTKSKSSRSSARRCWVPASYDPTHQRSQSRCCW
jgi:hypothetical protein